MNITKYFQKLNNKSQEIFSSTLATPALLGKAHSGADELFQLSVAIEDADEREMLATACAQIETSCLAVALGLYRPGIGSLRLALELGLGCVYFSAHKLLHREWMANGDLKWANVISEEDGVFSSRFAKAFFPELSESVQEFREEASRLYRELSEYVHGNSRSWTKSGLTLKASSDMLAAYEDKLERSTRILKIAFCCRYLKATATSELESVTAAVGDLNHIAAIREFLGGPKEVK